MYRGVNQTAFKEEFDAENLWKCWKECLDKSDYHSRNAKVEEFNRKNYWKKKGIAIIPMKFSVGFNATYFHQVALSKWCFYCLISLYFSTEKCSLDKQA